MKQYKDDLLAACLTYILALPRQIVAMEIQALVPALQVRDGGGFCMCLRLCEVTENHLQM